MIQKLLLNSQMTWMIFCKNIEECNPNKKQKVLIVFADVIADMLNNNKLNPVITGLFIRGKNQIFLIF